MYKTTPAVATNPIKFGISAKVHPGYPGVHPFTRKCASFKFSVALARINTFLFLEISLFSTVFILLFIILCLCIFSSFGRGINEFIATEKKLQ